MEELTEEQYLKTKVRQYLNDLSDDPSTNITYKRGGIEFISMKMSGITNLFFPHYSKLHPNNKYWYRFSSELTKGFSNCFKGLYEEGDESYFFILLILGNRHNEKFSFDDNYKGEYLIFPCFFVKRLIDEGKLNKDKNDKFFYLMVVRDKETAYLPLKDERIDVSNYLFDLNNLLSTRIKELYQKEGKDYSNWSNRRKEFLEKWRDKLK